jgi:hypothetical protein
MRTSIGATKRTDDWSTHHYFSHFLLGKVQFGRIELDSLNSPKINCLPHQKRFGQLSSYMKLSSAFEPCLSFSNSAHIALKMSANFYGRGLFSSVCCFLRVSTRYMVSSHCSANRASFEKPCFVRDPGCAVFVLMLKYASK